MFALCLLLLFKINFYNNKKSKIKTPETVSNTGTAVWIYIRAYTLLGLIWVHKLFEQASVMKTMALTVNKCGTYF